MPARRQESTAVEMRAENCGVESPGECFGLHHSISKTRGSETRREADEGQADHVDYSVGA
jgi:hypothetical protein